MSKAVKYAEKAVVYAAKGAWVVYERLNRISPNASFTPKWSDKPLQKSWQKEKPPLGWPRLRVLCVAPVAYYSNSASDAGRRLGFSELTDDVLAAIAGQARPSFHSSLLPVIGEVLFRMSKLGLPRGAAAGLLRAH